MKKKNQDSWNRKWLAQQDQAEADLIGLCTLRDELELRLDQLNLNIEMQAFLVAIIETQIKPRAPE